MSPTRVFVIVLLAGALLLNGCATNRGLVSLTTPTSDKVAPSKGMEIYIRSVVDKRIFEEAPKSPDIPSLDPSEPQGEDIKRRAIARKRNTFGKGLGDILLNQGQTVMSVISDSLRQAFIEDGYTVVGNSANLGKNSRIVDVEINKFWSWMNPGFWAITLSTEIGTDVTIVQGAGEGEKKTVHVKADDNFQTAVEGNWLSVMHTALKDYINEAKAKIK